MSEGVGEIFCLPKTAWPPTVIGADSQTSGTVASVPSEEKYEIKSGDTLDKIAYRFYGKYDVEKIEAIQKINNITNPSALQIGQVIIIPVDSQR